MKYFLKIIINSNITDSFKTIIAMIKLFGDFYKLSNDEIMILYSLIDWEFKIVDYLYNI